MQKSSTSMILFAGPAVHRLQVQACWLNVTGGKQLQIYIVLFRHSLPDIDFKFSCRLNDGK